MSQPSQNRFVIFAVVIVAAVTFVIYSGVLHNDFVGWDDTYYVLNSPFLVPLSISVIGKIFTSFYFASYTPLALLSHTIDFNIWGMDPRGHHLTNLMIHAGNACLVFFLAFSLYRRMKSRDEGSLAGNLDIPLVSAAAVAALLFALHPLRVESVACVSSRKDLLGAFLLLSSILCMIRDAEFRGQWRGRGWYLCALGFYVLSLLAKGAAMSFAGVLVMLDFLLDGEWISWKRTLVLVKEKIPFVAAGSAAAVVAYVASEVASKPDIGIRALPVLDHGQTGLYNLAFYLDKTLWPVPIAELYLMPTDWRLWMGISMTIVVTVGVTWAFFRGRTVWGIAWGAYVAAILPMAGFIPASIQLISNRYAYVAALPFVLLAGAGLLRVWRRVGRNSPARYLTAGLAVLVPVVLAVLTVRQIPWWQDAESVWRATIAASPDHCVAYVGLGNAMQEKREIDSAIVYFHKALVVNPTYDRAIVALGGAYLEKKDTAEAEGWLQLARRRLPGYSTVYVSLGTVRVLEGRYDEADSLYAEAFALDSTNFTALVNRAVIALERKNEDVAVRFLREGLRINPNCADAYFVLGRIRLQKKETKEEGYALVRRSAALGSLQAQKLLLGLGGE